MQIQTSRVDPVKGTDITKTNGSGTATLTKSTTENPQGIYTRNSHNA